MSLTRSAALIVSVCLVLAGCSPATDRDGGTQDAAPSSSTTPSTSPGTSDGVPSVAATPTSAPHPVSLPALMDKEIRGEGLKRVAEVATTEAYAQHRVSYRSGDLTISGLMNVPRGKGPFPAVVLAHGYIDPDVYANGQGLRREQDLLAREGFVTLHVDYRGHAQSDPSTEFEQSSRLGYTEDVISAVLALRAWDGPVDDDRVALLGRSMGGGVVYNALTVSPGLVDAAVVFAPVSSDMVDNFERWGRPNAPLARRIISEYGEPADEPEFWSGLSARTYFDRVSEPVMIHHGTADDSCPIAWSEETVAALEAQGKDVTYHVYQDEQHAFGPQWPLSMERTVAFLRKNLA